MTINRSHKNGNMRGFTLLELLIAISLLAIGLLAAATMQGISMNANSYANRISVATMVGQQVAEDLSSLKITDPLLNAGVSDVTYKMIDPATNASTSTVSIQGAGTFSARYDIEPNFPITGTTKITVRVFYIGTVGTYGSTTTPIVTFSTYKMVI